MYTLYVGSPNEARILNEQALRTITSITSKYFESYTYTKARGVFRNTEEDMVMIKIATNERTKVYELGEELRSSFRQEGVGVEHNGVYERLITQ